MAPGYNGRLNRMDPIELTARATLAFLGLLAAMALYRAIAGRVRWLGLLAGPEAGERRLRPVRAQLLAVIVLAVLIYPGAAGAAAGRPGWLAAGLPLIVAASNLIYLWDEYRLRSAGLSAAASGRSARCRSRP